MRQPEEKHETGASDTGGTGTERVGGRARTSTSDPSNVSSRPPSMRQGKNPYGVLPIAVAGIVVGIGLVLGCGALMYHEWPEDGHASPTTPVKVEGKIEWAGWRRSARPDGPRWFLQVRMEGDPRRYIVSGDRVPASYREQVGQPRSGEITELGDKHVTVFVDSSLLKMPTPYLSGLHVGGETVVPVENAQSTSFSVWGRVGLLSLLGAAALVGLGTLAASVHHVVVCVRYGRRRSEFGQDNP